MASLEGKSSSGEFALETGASAVGVGAHPASGCQKTRKQNSQAVAGAEDRGGGSQLGRRRPCFGMFPWIWESSRKGGLGLAIGAVQRQMAAGSRVPSPGEGAGDGSRHGLDGFLQLGARFAEEKKGKVGAKANARVHPSPALAALRSWSRRQSQKHQPGSWTMHLPPASSIKLLGGQRGEELLQPGRRFPLDVAGWLTALPVPLPTPLPVLPIDLHPPAHGPGSSLV